MDKLFFENTKIKQKKLISILSVITILALIIYSAFYFQFSSQKPLQANANASESVALEKAYKYSIDMLNNAYILKGAYTNGETYILRSNFAELHSAITMIDYDSKKSDELYSDVEINFNNLYIGNASLHLKNGNYKILGAGVFTNISANACFMISNGANVTFDKAVFENLGTSDLIETQSDNSKIIISSSKLTSNGIVVKSNYATNIKITNSNLQSKSSNVLCVKMGSVGNFQDRQILINENSVLTSQGNISAVGIKNVGLTLLDAKISALMAHYALNNEGGQLNILGNTQFLSMKNAFQTNNAFNTKVDELVYMGSELNVFYAGDLSEDREIIKNYKNDILQKINVLNDDFATREINNIVYIAKKNKIFYHSNCDDALIDAIMPQNDTEYFNNERVQIEFLAQDIRPHFNFVGYAIDIALEEVYNEREYVFKGKDLHLYALWTPIEYEIEYVGLDGAINENASNYNYADGLNLVAPTLDYHTFVGWQVDGEEEILESLKLPYKEKTNISLKAVFKLTTYEIKYNNLSEEEIINLDLKTCYTIEDLPYDFGAQNYLMNGNSFCGVYADRDFTQNLNNVKIDFTPSASNLVDFVCGETFNIYVDTRVYHNGAGVGTKNAPYLIDTSSQFYNFLVGEKVQNRENTYIKINNDIILNNETTFTLIKLKNFVIDGNYKSFIIKNFIKYKIGSDECESIFPILEHCELFNIQIKNSESKSVINVVNHNIKDSYSFSAFAYGLYDSYINNIDNLSVIALELNTSNDYSNAHISGLINRSVDSVLQNAKFSGDIKVQGVNMPNSLYLCGVSAVLRGSAVLNSTYKGSLTIDCNDALINENFCAYSAGIGILENENLIVNCASKGEINIFKRAQNLGVVSDLVMVLGTGNEITNCLTITDSVLSDIENQNISNSAFIWSIDSGLKICNCYYRLDENKIGFSLGNLEENNKNIKSLSLKEVENLAYVGKLNSTITHAVSAVDEFIQKSSINDDFKKYLVVQRWFALDGNTSESFEPMLRLTVVDKARGVEYEYYFRDNKINDYVFPLKDGYLFTHYSIDKNGRHKVENLAEFQGDVLVYANYISFNQYIWSHFIIWFLLGMLVLALTVAFVVVCELKKTVTYIFDGKVVNTQKVRINTEMPILNEYDNIMWFYDRKDKTPFRCKKMPFVWRELKLVSYNDEIRLPLEKHFEKIELAKQKFLEEEKIAKEKELQDKKKQREEMLLMKKSKNEEKQKLREKARLERKEKVEQAKLNNANRSTSANSKIRKTQKQKLKEEIENSGVTIIKKEIKTIKTDRDR